MGLTATANLRINSTLNKALDLVTPAAVQSFQYLLELTDGAGLNQADTVWSDTRTVNASTTDTLDLVGGGLVDALGDAFAPARMKGLIVRNRGAQNITVGRPALNGVAWLSADSDSVVVVPGGAFVWFAPTAAGIVVTAGSADLIDVVNGAGSAVNYDVIVFGAKT